MDPTERRKRVMQEAADWWAVLQGDDLSRAEREGFIDWLRESQLHIAEILRLTQVHGALEHFKLWNEISTDGLDNDETVIPLSGQVTNQRAERSNEAQRGPQTGRLRLFAVAASALAVATITALLVMSGHGQWISTDRGQRLEVVLDDGSIVQVDPQSRLNVRFEKSARRVLLAQGRAVFHVAKKPDRPFLVQADNTTVRAIGTAFGVERRGSDVVVVTVSEGKVAVGSLRERPPPRLETLGGGRSVQPPGMSELLLTADQQVTVADARPSTPVRNVDSHRELAWSEGRLVFKDDTVATVVTEFNRYNRVQLTVSDPALAARRISGVFNAANPEAFIAFIQNTVSVQIEREDGKSVVISSVAARD